MAGSLGDFADRLITSLGGKPTKASRNLFNSWQRFEGGHTHNAASWNPLNLTAPGSGLPTINSVGVVAMPNENAGVKRTANLLRSGYPALANAMKTGMVDFKDPAIQGDLNRWLTGKRTPGTTPYVSKIAAAYGQALPMLSGPPAPGMAAPAAPATPAAPPVPQKPVFDRMAYANAVGNAYASGGGRMDLTKLSGMVDSSFVTPPSPPAAPASAPPVGVGAALPPPKGKGGYMLLPTKWKTTHPTDGLADEGFTHAEDIMGAPGTRVGAPVGGTVMRHGSAQGGQSLWFKGDDGRTYWIGHIESNIPEGTRVERGGVLATISADHPRPHVHLDYS